MRQINDIMFEDIINRQRIVARNILKGFESTETTDEFDEVVKGYMNDIEKAHNVGDVFYKDGKKYVYTQLHSGKRDWRIGNKNTVIKGSGIGGLHGLKAIESVYSSVDSSYTDTNKIMLKRTPNGHWRLFYDNNDIGTSIAGDAITEQELIKDNVCYQRNRVVDNFTKMKDYMEFDSPDDVYFVQIIKRWKDNSDKPGAEDWRQNGKIKGTYHSGAEYLNYYLIHSYAELESLKSQIVKVCSYNNARAYISINSRNQRETTDYMNKIKSRYAPNDPRSKFIEPILYGQAKTGPAWKDKRLKVLLDIDALRDAKAKMVNGKTVNVWDETKRRLNAFGIKVAAEYETPSGGLHLILNNKNNRNLKPFFSGLKDFDGGKSLGFGATVHPSEDIKMVLYSNVDTKGY
jgi:hypothetical protein